MDLVLSRSFMSYCILFWGPSTVSRKFLAVIKNHGFDPFSQFMSYCILFWAPSTVLRAFLAFIKTRGFVPFSQLYELLHIVLGAIGLHYHGNDNAELPLVGTQSLFTPVRST